MTFLQEGYSLYLVEMLVVSEDPLFSMPSMKPLPDEKCNIHNILILIVRKLTYSFNLYNLQETFG